MSTKMTEETWSNGLEVPDSAQLSGGDPVHNDRCRLSRSGMLEASFQLLAATGTTVHVVKCSTVLWCARVSPPPAQEAGGTNRHSAASRGG